MKEQLDLPTDLKFTQNLYLYKDLHIPSSLALLARKKLGVIALQLSLWSIEGTKGWKSSLIDLAYFPSSIHW